MSKTKSSILFEQVCSDFLSSQQTVQNLEEILSKNNCGDPSIFTTLTAKQHFLQKMENFFDKLFPEDPTKIKELQNFHSIMKKDRDLINSNFEKNLQDTFESQHTINKSKLHYLLDYEEKLLKKMNLLDYVNDINGNHFKKRNLLLAIPSFLVSGCSHEENLSKTICSEFLSSSRTNEDFKNILIRNQCDKDTFKTFERKKIFMYKLDTQLTSTFQKIRNDVKDSIYKQHESTPLDESQEALLDQEIKNQMVSLSSIAIDSICGWTDDLNDRKTLSQKCQKRRF